MGNTVSDAQRALCTSLDAATRSYSERSVNCFDCGLHYGHERDCIAITLSASKQLWRMQQPLSMSSPVCNHCDNPGEYAASFSSYFCEKHARDFVNGVILLYPKHAPVKAVKFEQQPQTVVDSPPPPSTTVAEQAAISSHIPGTVAHAYRLSQCTTLDRLTRIYAFHTCLCLDPRCTQKLDRHREEIPNLGEETLWTPIYNKEKQCAHCDEWAVFSASFGALCDVHATAFVTGKIGILRGTPAWGNEQDVVVSKEEEKEDLRCEACKNSGNMKCGTAALRAMIKIQREEEEDPRCDMCKLTGNPNCGQAAKRTQTSDFLANLSDLRGALLDERTRRYAVATNACYDCGRKTGTGHTSRCHAASEHASDLPMWYSYSEPHIICFHCDKQAKFTSSFGALCLEHAGSFVSGKHGIKKGSIAWNTEHGNAAVELSLTRRPDQQRPPQQQQQQQQQREEERGDGMFFAVYRPDGTPMGTISNGNGGMTLGDFVNAIKALEQEAVLQQPLPPSSSSIQEINDDNNETKPMNEDPL